MNDGKTHWRGSFPQVITPFTRQGEIDEENFASLLELLISEGIGGMIVAGSSGESWALDAEERLRLFALAVKLAADRVAVIGGLNHLIISQVIPVARAAKELGVGGVSLIPPYLAGVNIRGVVNLFKAISDGASIPIMIDNMPGYNGINVTPDLCAELADIEYVVALKDSSRNFGQIEMTLTKLGDRIQVFSGHSATYGVLLVLMGCAGCGGSLEQQVMGREGTSLYDFAATGEIEAAKRVQLRANELYMRMRSAVGTGPDAFKAAMSLLGRPSGHVRPPLADLTGADRDRVGAILDDLGFPVRG